MEISKLVSVEQEKYLAKIFKGKIPANSGGTKFGGGDVLTQTFLIEAKTTTKAKGSFAVKKEWLIKSREQAFEQNKSNSALAIQFEPGGDNYFVINEKLMKLLVEYLDTEV